MSDQALWSFIAPVMLQVAVLSLLAVAVVLVLAFASSWLTEHGYNPF